jgi:hypothetical protein
MRYKIKASIKKASTETRQGFNIGKAEEIHQKPLLCSVAKKKTAQCLRRLDSQGASAHILLLFLLLKEILLLPSVSPSLCSG